VRVADYRAEAERFSEAIERASLLHGSGRVPELELEPVYARHAALFSRAAVDALRSAGERELLGFAVDGLIGQELAPSIEAAARSEAALELDLDGGPIPFRRATAALANEPDAERRAEIERARVAAIATELDPILREAHERSAALVRELGWPNVVAMRAELMQVDIGALAREARAFLDRTADAHRAALEGALRDELGLDRGRRCDVPALLRACSLDRDFGDDALLPSLHATAAALGLPLAALPNVHLDTEPRPRKATRAFCAPVRVPDEVHLVIPRVGGRGDYSALFHEAGHALHCACADPALGFERRRRGDVAVTEGFAFLLERLVSDAGWLGVRLGVADPARHAERGRAERLLLARRYCAKLVYEAELLGGGDPAEMPERYARLLSEAVGVEWPRETWLHDVDPGLYVVYYLRAWALEVALRRRLDAASGDAWHGSPAAGDVLRRLWGGGHPARAESLSEELGDGHLRLASLADDLGVPEAA
jgi:hypothetical protein